MKGLRLDEKAKEQEPKQDDNFDKFSEGWETEKGSGDHAHTLNAPNSKESKRLKMSEGLWSRSQSEFDPAEVEKAKNRSRAEAERAEVERVERLRREEKDESIRRA